MAQEELHKLRIDKTAAGARPPRSRRPWLRYGLALAVLAGAAAAYLQAFPPRPTVEAAQVIQVYPTQAYTALSASGYVVAQRKAAVAAKTTSRLVWLGVEEGSRVREGEIIARLEGDDVEAARRQAAANLLSAQAGLASARAELHDAALNFSRQTELFRQRLVAKADYDAAEARHLKAQAAVASAGAAIAASQAAPRSTGWS
jgi:multidrug efflux pump subunit AcrA (membrane-fusion protein)